MTDAKPSRGNVEECPTCDEMGAMLLDRATVVPVPLETLRRWEQQTARMLLTHGCALGDRAARNPSTDYPSHCADCRDLRAALTELRALIEESRS